MKKNKSFLKFAGGKVRIVEKLLAEFPTRGRFIEPFVGSGTVWLNTSFQEALLSDKNKDLIQVFTVLKNDELDFIDYCETFFTPKNNTKEKFYELRHVFNTTNNIVLHSALFVYLNRHSFNGLIRYNASGGFNAPFGKYDKPYFPRFELMFFYNKICTFNPTFVCKDFREILSGVGKGDVVYCDPPYTPLSKTSNFTTYVGCVFSKKDQEDLVTLAVAARKRGAFVCISNHDTVETRALYAEASVVSFPVRRSISCKSSGRIMANELCAIYQPD